MHFGFYLSLLFICILYVSWSVCYFLLLFVVLLVPYEINISHSSGIWPGAPRKDGLLPAGCWLLNCIEIQVNFLCNWIESWIELRLNWTTKVLNWNSLEIGLNWNIIELTFNLNWNWFVLKLKWSWVEMAWNWIQIELTSICVYIDIKKY